MTAVTEAAVRGVLAEDPNLDMRDIQVQVEGARVILSGFVRTQRERNAAEMGVRQIRGVEAVANNLVVTGEPI